MDTVDTFSILFACLVVGVVVFSLPGSRVLYPDCPASSNTFIMRSRLDVVCEYTVDTEVFLRPPTSESFSDYQERSGLQYMAVTHLIALIIIDHP